MPSSALSLPSAQEAAQELLTRRRARRSLLDFSRYVMPDFEVSWHHALICDYLDRFVTGDIRRLMIFCPPRHGKSQLVSRHLPAYILGRDPDASIIACSYAADLASRMTRDVQRVIDSDPYRRLFPGSQLSGKNVRTVAGPLPLRNSEMFELVGRRGSYRAAGRGQGITGMGGRFLIVDDPLKDREEADSPAVRESLWEWYSSTFRTRLEAGGRIAVMHTRWHNNDLAGRLLARAQEDAQADQWSVLSLPAICQEEGRPGDPRKIGEALWPTRYSLTELEPIRANSPREWDALYQQNPRPEGGTEWPDDFFGPDLFFGDGQSESDWPRDLLCRVLACDPSKGKADKSGDYSAWVMLGVDSSNPPKLWVDADLDNARPVEPLESQPGAKSLVTDGVALAKLFSPHAVLIETNGFQELVATAFQRWCAKLGAVVPVYTICNTIPKPVRIRSLAPYLSQKRLRVRNTRGGRLLVQQMRDFPTGLHDDGPDALKTAEMMADHLLNGGDSVQLLRG